MRRQRHRLDEELPENRPRVAPSALRTPISRVRSVTEIIMIAIDAHAADEQADRRQHDHHEKEHAEDLVVRLEQLVLRDDREVVVGAGRSAVARRASRRSRRPAPVARHVRRAERPRCPRRRTPRCSDRYGRLERHDRARAIAAGEEARLVVVDADDRERHAADRDDLVERVRLAEQAASPSRR